MKKKKTSWKTWAGLLLAAGAWRKLSTDLPIDGVIIPPAERPEPITCDTRHYLKNPMWDPKAEKWRCVPKGLL